MKGGIEGLNEYIAVSASYQLEAVQGIGKLTRDEGGAVRDHRWSVKVRWSANRKVGGRGGKSEIALRTIVDQLGHSSEGITYRAVCYPNSRPPIQLHLHPLARLRPRIFGPQP